jgi:hypothetical protein
VEGSSHDSLKFRLCKTGETLRVSEVPTEIRNGRPRNTRQKHCRFSQLVQSFHRTSHFFRFLNQRTVLKSSVFWDKMPCSTLKINRRFGGTYRLYLQGRRINRARSQLESMSQAEGQGNSDFLLLLLWFLSQFILQP